jgi:GxxExxY protein
MNADDTDKEVPMKHAELTEKIIGVFYEAYNELGHGFLESVCEGAMMIALEQAGLRAERQVPIAIWFRGHNIGVFFADIVVEGLVILELKCARNIDPAHEAQLLNYLRATTIEVGHPPELRPPPRVQTPDLRQRSKERPSPNLPALIRVIRVHPQPTSI